MTQIFLFYSSDLNCTLLVVPQNQTCDGLSKKLFCSVSEEAQAKVALQGQHGWATGNDSPALVFFLGLCGRLNSAGVSAQGWPGHLSVLQGPGGEGSILVVASPKSW